VKDRFVTILLTIAVIGLIVWICANLSFKEVQVRVPLSGEAARNPFYAAIRLSQELGAEAEWERVFTAPPADSVILLSSWNWSLSRARRERIQQWVEAGGRLIVDDSLIGDLDEFEKWSGVGTLEQENDDEEMEEEEEVEESIEETPPAEQDAEPDDNSFTAGIFEPDCTMLSENGSTRQLEVCGIDVSRSLTSSRKILWSLRQGKNIHALRTAVGRGSVTVINASPFRFRDFLMGDHPRLFVTLSQLRRGDTLMFLTEEDRASLLSLMWRFGAPAVLLLAAAVFLALWRSFPRFGPSAAPTTAVRRSLAEQIRGTAQFALRFGGGEALHTATVRALRDAAIRRFPSYDRMSSAERVAALAKASQLSADDIGPALHYSGHRSSHELRNAIAILETVRRRLIMKAKHGN
jgi:hypothetical protein